MSDSLVPLYKYINSDLHPLAFQIIIYQFVRNIGPSIGSGTLGFALLAIIQILLESYIVAYFMRWLTEKKAPRFLIIFSGLFLCFCPIIVCYATAVLKDSWLMFSLLLFLPNYYDFLFEEEVKPKSKFWLCVSLAMILLSRTNGIMLVIGALIPMIVWKLKSEKIFLLICILLIILINSVTSKIIESQNLGNHSFRELASIQLVQVGAAFHYEGEISNDEYEFFTKILPAEKWKENYAFSFVDYIKYSEEFNEDYFLSHQSDFTKHWWSLLIKNPDIFGRAYLYQTYGAWNISFSDPSLYAGPQSTFYSLTANCPDDIIEIVRRDYDLENIQILPDWINTLLAGYYKLGFENSMIAPGFIMLIILFISTLLIIDKKSKYILAFMPIAAGWLGFIISPPGSFIYRYYVFITISIPFILFVLFKNIKK